MRVNPRFIITDYSSLKATYNSGESCLDFRQVEEAWTGKEAFAEMLRSVGTQKAPGSCERLAKALWIAFIRFG